MASKMHWKQLWGVVRMRAGHLSRDGRTVGDRYLCRSVLLRIDDHSYTYGSLLALIVRTPHLLLSLDLVLDLLYLFGQFRRLEINRRLSFRIDVQELVHLRSSCIGAFQGSSVILENGCLLLANLELLLQPRFILLEVLYSKLMLLI